MQGALFIFLYICRLSNLINLEKVLFISIHKFGMLLLTLSSKESPEDGEVQRRRLEQVIRVSYIREGDDLL